MYTRVLSTLLNEMDGVETKNTNILILAATSRVDALDAVCFMISSCVSLLSNLDRPYCDQGGLTK